MTFKAILFDMDGVLIDSEPLWELADIALIAQYGHVMTQTEYVSKFKSSVYGKSQIECAKEFIEYFTLDETPENFVKKRIESLLKIYETKLELMPGVEPVLKELGTRDLKLAVVSSSPAPVIEFVLTKFALRGSFQQLVSADSVLNGKPAPDVYQKAAKLLRLEPVDCLALEDSPVGIQAAKSAGMSCIALRNEANAQLDLTVADTEIASWGTFLATLDSL